MLLQGAVNAYVAAMDGIRSRETIVWYCRRLGSLVGFLGADRVLESITIHDLREWRSSLVARKVRYARHPNRPPISGGLSKYTLQSYVRAVRALFAWLEFEDLIEVNPARRLELPGLPAAPRRGVSESDMIAILELARRDARDYAICMFLCDTACRAAGLAGLRLDDLDLDNGRALVREKGDKARMVFVGPTTIRAMRRWLACRPGVPGCDLVFVTRRSNRDVLGLTVAGVYQVLGSLARRAGVRGRFSPHEWRHAAARFWLSRGMNLAQVSQLLGHADVGVTVKHYGGLAVGELQEAHDRYGRKFE